MSRGWKEEAENQQAAEESNSPPRRTDVLRDIEDVGIGLFWATNKKGELSYLSTQALDSLGDGGESLIGQQLSSVFTEASIEAGEYSGRSIKLRMKANGKIDHQIVEINLNEAGRDDPSKHYWWRITARPKMDRVGGLIGYRGVATDITSEFRHQQSIAKQSQYDELTGLANRRRIGHKLSTMLNSFKTSGRSCALLMLDLDRFKQVNDTLGHPAGDELLKQVAQRLQALIKDRGEVGRMGGDEFQILLPDMDDRNELGELSRRIIQMLSQPYSINGRRAQIGTSVGIAIAPYDGVDVDEIHAAADLALYAAKESGKGAFRFYTADLKDDASRGVRIEEGLRDALHRGELTLNYQPLVDPKSDTVKSFEALMRWQHPDEGPISPSLFIPIAEQTDLIIKLGDWALRQACMDAARWPGDARVAVNVSAKQFMSSDFRKSVASALAASELPPARLELEITESVFVGDVEHVDKTFASLKRLGVRMAMDDFGTGYSSLGYLKRAPFDKIKIDQSFVHGCTEGGDTNPAIITAIVSLAKSLEMETVAEGVEAMDELKLVKDRGADFVQGYIYSRPLTHEQVLERLENGNLVFRPNGPPRYRADRMTVFRKIGLIHEDHYYDVMLRNLSKTGARIEGLAGVPQGEEVVLDLGGGQLVVSKVIHSEDGTQGVEFEVPLVSDGYNGLVTRNRISPYVLAEAGMPLAALGSGAYPMEKLLLGAMSVPKFTQLELS
ncbi:EAL domain-containing protein [Erythrobacter ani]|uniref:EAL domain-containing protein n=1 Tax=Erythrobacter ani TaxID=2827235 RepID=A0ABS6SJA6_9SPHN|nr:EAL domain-containing protein [Erythrobacter ani]MBV7264759.1 EAL domain-containing protein [Erythrobacter ani]